ncbi:hypothetical protein [Tenacibaculum soleae]|uniref:hypothetical protein n=1 Tax=Tenacibaculum soleae TaxID=447689 RepID=UPI0026E42729|nr:hypothetical protein [Tenacibaculum soleae]MDO6813830.1 hypothetical protein [Tenacibaculum soleae]
MELLKQILGSQSVEVWLAGMFWSLQGIIAIKLYYLPSKEKFNLKFWLNDNLIDVVKGLFWSLVALRLGDYLIQVLRQKMNFDLPETTDFVVYMIIISAVIQYKLHQNRTPVLKNKQLK